MASRSHSMRLGRVLGIAALALAISAPVAMGKEITSGGGGGGGGTTPTPTASPCATVESFTFKASKGPGSTAEVDTGFNIVSCSTNSEAIVFDMKLSGVTNKVVYWEVPAIDAGTLAPGKNSSQKWTLGGLPFNTLVRLDIVVKDAATGAVLDTQVGSALTPQNKP